jgi:hypothetical protein
MDDIFANLLKGGGSGGKGGKGDNPFAGIPGLEGLGSKDEIMGHASRLWEFMDELAQNPEEYQK